MTFGDEYVEAITNAIRKLDSPDEIVKFLDKVAEDLHALNKYANDDTTLRSQFAAFLANIEEISQ